MKNLILTIVLLWMLTTVYAQEYKIARSSGKIKIIEVNDVTIEGYDGKEIVFSSRNNDRESDERAQGLRAVSSLGLEDNTGLGLSVKESGDGIEVRQLKKLDGPEIKIKVPKDVVISYEHSSPYGSDFKLRNLSNEVTASTVHNQVQLENVTGPVSIKTVHGDVDASFSSEIKNRISLVSVHGHVDVAIPASSKVNLSMETSWGELFVDPELKIDVANSGQMVRYNDKFSGKMNGGGIDIELASAHANVYVRKNK